jgi:hypothetical protein
MYILGGSTTPGWIRVSGNAILNGPSDDRDLGNLYPSVDNDDGSSLYWVANNVMIYGGAKNYLGDTKIWQSNIIVFPDRWSGDACLTQWGGEHHVFSNNTCVVQSDFPLALDSSIEGNTCAVNYTDPAAAPFLASLRENTYHTASGGYENGCAAPYYTLAALQAIGQELGSVAVKGYVAADIVGAARAMLGLPA